MKITATSSELAASAAPHSTPVLSPGLIILIASSVGLAVASLYYTQPMLGLLVAAGFADSAHISWVPTLTQIGYALGIFFLAPLGDRYNRKQILLMKGLLLIAALLTIANSQHFASLLAASLVLGLAATLAQDLVPAAAILAPEAQRGKVVGSVMTGLLLGILLSRVVSGMLAHYLGWTAIFYLAAGFIALSMAALYWYLPDFPATSSLPYGRLLGSTLALLRRYPALAVATASQACLQLGFSAFWSCLALMLQSPAYQLSSLIAGAFGLAGAAGALAAPLAGNYADKFGSERVARFGCMLTALSFLVMLGADYSPFYLAMAILVVSAIGFDMGVQIALIAHQTQIYGLDPQARSRLNAILLTGMFIGMACGSSLGGYLLGQFGNLALPGLGLTGAILACLLRLTLGQKSD